MFVEYMPEGKNKLFFFCQDKTTCVLQFFFEISGMKPTTTTSSNEHGAIGTLKRAKVT
jgi:hypothetical protein